MAGRLLASFVALVFAHAHVGCAGRESCPAITSEASGLRAEFERCAGADTCAVVDLYALAGGSSCLAAFQCTTAFRVGADLGDFSKRARDLAHRYENNCSSCAKADCPVRASAARCNTKTLRCEADDGSAGGASGGITSVAGNGGAGG